MAWDRGPWEDQAACKGMADLFTGDPVEVDGRTKEVRNRTVEAKRVCRTCPVLLDCRRWVLSLPKYDDVYGVCGGLSMDERRRRNWKANRNREGIAGHADEDQEDDQVIGLQEDPGEEDHHFHDRRIGTFVLTQEEG